MDRRNFMWQLGSVASMAAIADLHGAAIFDSLAQLNAQYTGYSPEVLASTEDYWFPIQQAFTNSPNIINLNNGGVSPQPLIVQQAHERYLRYANEAPTMTMWQQLDQGREPIRQRLAELAGCSKQELAICRNTTEALDAAILGIDLKPGDEVVLTKQDYPNMVHVWKQRERREGIVLKWISLELPLENDDDFVSQYSAAFTEKTKVVHVTHMINWVGQIVPVAKIARAAHARGIQVVSDSAHTFAHIDYSIPELECDYWGTSLHKWLCAPFGTGLMYVKKDKIKDLWALLPNDKIGADDIMKFEGLGTRNIAAEMAIGHALDFHLGIGTKRKEERLRFLKNYWAKKAKDIPGVKIHTSFKPEYACGLALFSIDGMKPADISSKLFQQHKIHVVAIEWENINGVRVTPHLYTKLSDLDRLVAGIEQLAKTRG